MVLTHSVSFGATGGLGGANTTIVASSCSVIGGCGRDRVLEHPNRRGRGSVRDRSADAVESERLAVVPTALEHPVGEQQQKLAGLQTPPVGREPARRVAETKHWMLGVVELDQLALLGDQQRP